MFQKKCLILYSCIILATAGYAQVPADTATTHDQSLAIDTTLNYDELLDEFAGFLDSLLAPRSYFLANTGIGEVYYDYKNNLRNNIISRKKLVFSPVLGYYHKSGPGITVSGNMIRPDILSNKSFSFYQYAITPSFDFIQNRRWTGGISYTHYFTRDSIKFYTTPLQNEISTYFLWRKSWVQPGLTINAAWGSRKDVEKRKEFLAILRWLARIRHSGGIIPPVIPVTTVTATSEDIFDFSITVSARHTFYWPGLFAHKDLLKLTPVISFSSGTQQYGFNQTTATYAGNLRATQFNKGDISLDNNLKFQPLSLTFYLRPEYSIGKFFIQPQFIMDYYFPTDENNFSILFSVNAGLMF